MGIIDPSCKYRAMLHYIAQLEWQCSSGGTALPCSAEVGHVSLSWRKDVLMPGHRGRARRHGEDTIGIA